MANKQTQYGWTYNKQGNKVFINHPFHVIEERSQFNVVDGKVSKSKPKSFVQVSKPRKIMTGGLLGGVGFGGVIGSNIR